MDTEWVKRESLTIQDVDILQKKTPKNIALEVDIALCLNKQPLIQNKPPALKFSPLKMLWGILGFYRHGQDTG